MSSTAHHRTTSFHRPSLVRALWMLFGIKHALKTRGFRDTLAWIERRRTKRAVDRSASRDEVRTVAHTIFVAAAFYPGRALCLEQSLALYALLVERCADVTLRFGVQPRPFAAHAWVEHRGEPVDEEMERLKLYAPFPTLVP